MTDDSKPFDLNPILEETKRIKVANRVPDFLFNGSDEPLTDGDLLRWAGAPFSIIGPQLSLPAIEAVFPGIFPGKDDFVQFYLRYNGGSRKPHGCIMHCGNAEHRVSRDRLDKLNLEGFRSIPLEAEDRMLPFANMLLHQATMERIYATIPEMKAFLDEHMAIAFDHSGNDLCLSRTTGRIFFMDWTAYKLGSVEIAPSFREFVLKFWITPQPQLD
jgi:hypothetical protein